MEISYVTRKDAQNVLLRVLITKTAAPTDRGLRKKYQSKLIFRNIETHQNQNANILN